MLPLLLAILTSLTFLMACSRFRAKNRAAQPTPASTRLAAPVAPPTPMSQQPTGCSTDFTDSPSKHTPPVSSGTGQMKLERLQPSVRGMVRNPVAESKKGKALSMRSEKKKKSSTEDSQELMIATMTEGPDSLMEAATKSHVDDANVPVVPKAKTKRRIKTRTNKTKDGTKEGSMKGSIKGSIKAPKKSSGKKSVAESVKNFAVAAGPGAAATAKRKSAKENKAESKPGSPPKEEAKEAEKKEKDPVSEPDATQKLDAAEKPKEEKEPEKPPPESPVPANEQGTQCITKEEVAKAAI